MRTAREARMMAGFVILVVRDERFVFNCLFLVLHKEAPPQAACQVDPI